MAKVRPGITLPIIPEDFIGKSLVLNREFTKSWYDFVNHQVPIGGGRNEWERGSATSIVDERKIS